jgi:hypothetical protein
MTYNLNERLARNFTLREVVEWPYLQNMTADDQRKANRLAIEALTPSTYAAAKRSAGFLQTIRDDVNAAFPQYNGKIGIQVLSWLRPRAWEIYRKRSGNGRHPFGDAVDIIVTGVTDFDTRVIMQWIWNKHQNHNGGLARLYKNDLWSFIHFDFGPRRRWEY